MLAQPPIWLMAVAFILALGPLVFLHELGHYLVGRLFGVGAKTFSIGFGHEIAGWTDKRGTRWKVGWLQFGGYVQFIGDMSAASAPGDVDELPPELRERSFPVKPVWQRFLIVLAGPLTNFLVAIAILAAFFTFVGTPISNVVGQVQPGSAAAAAGIQPGDRILSVASLSTPTFSDLSAVVVLRPNEPVSLTLKRGGAVHRLNLTLGSDVIRDRSGQMFKRGLLGITPADQLDEPVSILKAVPMAIGSTFRIARSDGDLLGRVFTGGVSANQLGGPLRIAQVGGEVASEGLLPFVSLIAFLSINLGFINLLPVPMLDGGHLFFYILEALRRRPVSPRFQEWAFRGGLAFIAAVYLLLTMNDLGSFGLWDRLGRLIG
jgi:regulator of sigma E protease